jgi:hypothetical protein
MKINLPGRRSLIISRETLPEDWQVNLHSWTQCGWDEYSNNMTGDFVYRVIEFSVCYPKDGIIIQLNLATQYQKGDNYV